MKFLKSVLLICFTFFVFQCSFAQLSKHGLPPSYSNFNLKQKVQKIDLLALKPKNFNDGKQHSDQEATPHKIGFLINSNFSIRNSGSWTVLKDGRQIWRLHIQSKNAEALAVYFKEFQLSDDAELFIYKPDYSQILGAYTADNNNEAKLFATELIEGDEFIIEYVLRGEKINAGNPPFVINEVAYIYRDAGFDNNGLKGFGSSDDCEININCEEGIDWQDQKRGIAKIQVKDQGGIWLCSGSLINNVNRDLMPYFLTANHCGSNATEADYNQWIFYFNYESEDCNDPLQSPIPNTLVGASWKASTTFSSQSDFKLLLLNTEVPEDFNPYFNGWDNRNIASTSGVSIHHPDGDIKKISTYNNTLLSTSYDDTNENIEGKYWQVIWGETTNGQGVTEGGSSGAPIFNSDGVIIGSLTGGLASCSNQNGPDYYGKLSYSWESAGSDPIVQLKAWLDPNNMGINVLNGMGMNEIPFESAFTANDTTAVPVEFSLDFKDLSIGDPNEWTWTFEGGTPNVSADKDPSGITYNEIGFYDVKLKIRRGLRVDSLLLENYVKVVPRVSPNPSSDKVQIYLGVKPLNDVEITLFDESGRIVDQFVSTASVRTITFYVNRFSSGFYFMRIKTEKYQEIHKLAIF